MSESSRVRHTVQKSETIKKNKINYALNLPSICNINARSVYNKLDELHTFINEEDIDIVFVTETWEREELTLEEAINLEIIMFIQM